MNLDQPQKPELGPVEGVTLSSSGSSLIIEYRWFKPRAYFFGIFSLFWNGSLIFIYRDLIAKEGLPLAALLFPALHVGFGVYFLYYSLCLFLNRTSLKISETQIEIRHHPLPWIGSGKIQKNEISQIFVKQKITKHKTQSIVTYAVMAVLERSKPRPLVTDISDYSQALKIEQEIERFISIEDQVSEGEHRPY